MTSVYFGSAKAIENYFFPRLEGMELSEMKEFLTEWKKEHRIFPVDYTATELIDLLV